MKPQLVRRVALASCAALMSIGLVGPSVVPVHESEANFTDSQRASTALSAGRVPPVGSLSCNLLSGRTIRWSAPTGGTAPTGYRVIIYRANGTIFSDSGDLPASARQWTRPVSLSLVTGMRVHVYALGPGQWQSAPWIADIVQVTLIVVCNPRSAPEAP